MGLIAITGATGNVGGRVARRLAAVGADHRLVVRDASRVAALDGVGVAVAESYSDTDGMRRALIGAEVLLLVSGRESANRVEEHKSAVDGARDAGVERVVYLSFQGAAPDCTFTFGRDHWHTEAYIRDSGMDFTFLRDNLYQAALVQMVGPDLVIRGPGGDGRLAAVTHDDVADAAAAALTDAAHAGQTYTLTGPHAVSLAEAAAEISEASGRKVSYHAESVEEAYLSREPWGAPAFEVDGWVSSYLAIAAGDLATVTGDVHALTGHEPQDFRSYLAANPPLLAN